MSLVSWQPYAQTNLECMPIAGGTIYTYECAHAKDIAKSSVVALGAFDGLHVGHQALLREAVMKARSLGVPCVAITFDPDPDEVVGTSKALRRLLSTPDRRTGILQFGVDYVVALDFTHDVALRSPQEFVEMIEGITNPEVVFVGKNFRFGYRCSGSVDTLSELGTRYGYEVRVCELVQSHNKPVSATRIRNLLTSSRLDEANELLGRCHYVRGTVEHGRGEGTSFGFPTANVVIDPRDCMPAEGVYACYLTKGDVAWPAAANVGAPPTFTDESRPAFLEASLLGFSGDLYGSEVCVSFVAWLRASRPFDSLEELERTVLGNIDWVRTHLGDKALEVRP